MNAEFLATGKFLANGQEFWISERLLAKDQAQAELVAAEMFARYDSAYDTSVRQAMPVVQMEPIAVVPPAGGATGRIVCRHCGTVGHAGDYPFSTLPQSSQICDDCAA